jgi:hypothetical protein
MAVQAILLPLGQGQRQPFLEAWGCVPYSQFHTWFSNEEQGVAGPNFMLPPPNPPRRYKLCYATADLAGGKRLC